MSLLSSDTLLNQHSYYEASTRRLVHGEPLVDAVRADVVVIGAGFTGLTAAIDLAQQGLQVVVLEADRIGSGASGRNGGQALVGFASGQAELEQQLGLADAKRAWDISLDAVALLKERLNQHAIDADWRSGALTVATTARKARALRADADQWATRYGFETQWLDAPALSQHILSPRYQGGIHEEVSGHLHPLKYALGLAQVARSLGVRMHEHSAALSLDNGPPALVRTATGSVTADFVVLAANSTLGAWSPRIAPAMHARIMPVGTYIAATPPLSEAQAHDTLPSCSAVCDTQFVLDYFRLSADRRLLFGGRVSYTTMTPPGLKGLMQKRIAQVFPQLGRMPIDYLWGGFVDISMNRAPDWGRLAPHVYYAQGFSGHGVALTGMAGRLIAQAIQGQASGFDLFARLKHRPFPGGPLWRTPLLTLGMAYHRMKDWF